MAAPMSGRNSSNSDEKKRFVAVCINAIMVDDDDDDVMLEELSKCEGIDLQGECDEFLAAFKSLRDDKVKIGDYAEVTIAQQLSCQWSTAFRLEAKTIQTLCEKVAPHIRSRVGCGRPEIPLDKKVFVTLFFLAHQDQYRLIGERFNMSESTTHACVMEICDILVQHTLFDYIVWPNATKQIEISDFYEALKGLSGCIGCIDGTHVQIMAPTQYESDFYNRKGVHSIILQAVCDMELMFTHIDAGHPGRSHDGGVFNTSDLYFEPGDDISAFFARNEYYIVGDAAYGLKSYVMTPFRNTGHLTQDQKLFNKKLCGIRSDIERAFGKLKGRFKRLTYLRTRCPSTAKMILSACCVLHNFCIRHNDFFDGEEVVNNDDDDDNGNQAPGVTVDATGHLKRQTLMRNMRR